MKIIENGHVYLLKDIKTAGNTNKLVFYKDPLIHKVGHEGTSNQEVLRALIDRVKFMDEELPHRFNSEILAHLRAALALHEARHLLRLVDKNEPVEHISTYESGHIVDLA